MLEKGGLNLKISVLLTAVANQSKSMYQLLCNWHRIGNYPKVPQSEQIAQCLLQQAICKVKSLQSMCNGVYLNESNVDTRILDIPSICSVLRSYYELVFIFHNIYVMQNSPIEREIVSNMWQIRGMNNRQNLSTTQDKYIQQRNKEKEDIEATKKQILELSSKLNMSEEVRGQLKNILNYNGSDIRGFEFIKKENLISAPQ